MLSDYSSSVAIDTPENVVLDAEIAGFGSRCVAALIDYFILILVNLVVAYLYGQATRTRATDEQWQILLFGVIVFFIVIIYHLAFEFFWNGQTPGKRRLGLRVVQKNGLPLTTGSILIRNLVRIFDFLPPFYGIGLVTLFATRHTQRLGDLAANTVVIRERPQITLGSLEEDWRVHYQFISRLSPLPEYIHINGLTEDDRRAVVKFLQRRAEMQNKDFVVGLVAQHIAQRIDLPGGTVDFRSPQRAETFLEQIARAFEIELAA